MARRRNAAPVPRVGGWRAAHGAAAKGGATKVFEQVADGVRPAPPGAADPVERRSDGTVSPAGAAVLARMRWEAEKLPDFGDNAAPWLPPSEDLAPFDGARRELLAQRRAEVHAMTGAVSSGVGAMLRGWAYLHAAAEYWSSQFFATGDPKAFEQMCRAIKAASGEDARLRDAAAWEAAARPRPAPSWLRRPAPLPPPEEKK
jgi:hypothetical protein